MKYKLALVMSVLCAFSAWTEAKVKLPAILSDGMVLQRERPVKIWGNADKGENVTVVFKKKKFSTVAGEDGKWLVELPPSVVIVGSANSSNSVRLMEVAQEGLGERGKAYRVDDASELDPAWFEGQARWHHPRDTL